jgi:epoxyqueuosine reductase QueG
VDISGLSDKQASGFTKAILICMALSKEFVLEVYNDMHIPAQTGEFAVKEHQCDELADRLAEYIRRKGYRALSQSEASIEKSGNYDAETKTSALPHKTVARLAGLGFIGKNNLLVTSEYGCAVCMCTVLTDMPVSTVKTDLPSSKCAACNVCQKVCPTGAIVGNEWMQNSRREEIIDVFKCKTCLKCIAHCPQTLKYIKIRK